MCFVSIFAPSFFILKEEKFCKSWNNGAETSHRGIPYPVFRF